MEIVKEEMVRNVSEYKYYGFLCYLLKNSNEVRNMLLQSLLTFYDVESSKLCNEKYSKSRQYVGYDLKITEKSGYVEEFDCSISTDIDDLVVYLKVCTKDIKTIDGIRLKMQYNFYILCDSVEDVFNEFVIKDTDVRKVIGFDPKDLSVEEETYMDLHFTVSLDHIDEVEINSHFKEFMYMLKYNKPFDDKSSFYEMIELIHNDYLNSEEYALDLEYELSEARKRALSKN